jgi:hypothetical protein
MKFTTHFELHSQTTRLVGDTSHGLTRHQDTGFSPSMTSCSKELTMWFSPKLSLQITTRRSMDTDFKFELLPLHSQLLRQSLLVSFPPLIDMLKFSGYPYLIRGQSRELWGFEGGNDTRSSANVTTTQSTGDFPPLIFRGETATRLTLPPRPRTKVLELISVTLGQACLPNYQEAQCAFKDSMIHGILQFTLLIAFRCVLHRCENQEIRC